MGNLTQYIIWLLFFYNRNLDFNGIRGIEPGSFASSKPLYLLWEKTFYFLDFLFYENFVNKYCHYLSII